MSHSAGLCSGATSPHTPPYLRTSPHVSMISTQLPLPRPSHSAGLCSGATSPHTPPYLRTSPHVSMISTQLPLPRPSHSAGLCSGLSGLLSLPSCWCASLHTSLGRPPLLTSLGDTCQVRFLGFRFDMSNLLSLGEEEDEVRQLLSIHRPHADLTHARPIHATPCYPRRRLLSTLRPHTRSSHPCRLP